MDLKEILAGIDEEIARLQQARTLLASETVAKPKATRKKRTAIPTVTAKAVPGKRKLTPEGRKRIAEAMKRRWAERKKQAVK